MRYLLTAIVITFLVVSPSETSAKSFSVDRVHSDVTVAEDGTARVVESITYTFDGTYSYAYRSIPLRAGDRVFDVSVSEEGREYNRSTAEDPGNYSVDTRGDEVIVTWHFSARNQSRSFHLAYSAGGLCRRSEDVGEFYMTLFDNQTGGRVDEVSTRVELPGAVSPTDLRVFAHGPLHGEVEVVAPSTVTARVAPLWNGRYFDVRVLTPPEVFAAMVPDGSRRLQSILDQEAEWARESDRRREAEAQRREAWRRERERRAELSRRFLPVSILLAVVSLGMWFVYFRRYGWPHSVTVHAAPGEPPSERPPALISYLVSRAVTGPALVATLVDLAERGHLRITETTRESKGWFGSASTKSDYRFERAGDGDTLRPFEKSLLDFTLGEVGDGRSFTMSEFKKHASGKRSAVRKWFVRWTRMIKDAAREENLFEPYDTSAVLLNVLVGIGVAGAGIALTVMTESPIGVPAIACGALQAILTMTFTRHTPEARREALAWGAFRKHLKSVSRAMGRISLDSHEWSRYLAVGIIFGVYKKLLPCITISDASTHSAYPAWYVATMGGANMTSMADGVSTMISSVSTTMSSSTGAGGGASVGGGGGGGGGSAGAG
jgi:uncharacterized membrane protein